MNNRYDVVVYELATMKVARIVGKDMKLDGERNSAKARLATARIGYILREACHHHRANNYYGTAIVPAGKYALDAVLDPKDFK